MHTEYETATYAWKYDMRMGVGRFERKSDKALTFLETGTDCQLVRETFAKLWSMAGLDEITEERRDEVFDMYAAEFTYDP